MVAEREEEEEHLAVRWVESEEVLRVCRRAAKARAIHPAERRRDLPDGRRSLLRAEGGVDAITPRGTASGHDRHTDVRPLELLALRLLLQKSVQNGFRRLAVRGEKLPHAGHAPRLVEQLHLAHPGVRVLRLLLQRAREQLGGSPEQPPPAFGCRVGQDSLLASRRVRARSSAGKLARRGVHAVARDKLQTAHEGDPRGDVRLPALLHLVDESEQALVDLAVLADISLHVDAGGEPVGRLHLQERTRRRVLQSAFVILLRRLAIPRLQRNRREHLAGSRHLVVRSIRLSDDLFVIRQEILDETRVRLRRRQDEIIVALRPGRHALENALQGGVRDLRVFLRQHPLLVLAAQRAAHPRVADADAREKHENQQPRRMAPRRDGGASLPPHRVAAHPRSRPRVHGLALQETLQIRRHFLHRRIAVLGLETHRLVDDGAQLAVVAQRRQRSGANAVNETPRLRLPESGAAQHELVKREPEAVLIPRERIDSLRQPFRRHVAQRAVVALRHQRRRLAGIENGGEPEIAHMQHSVVVQQHVPRLDIAVEHAVLVGETQSPRRLQSDASHRLLVRSPLKNLAEPLRRKPAPLHETHHVIAELPLPPRAVHLDDIGVAQPRNEARLVLERLQMARIRAPRRRQNLDRHLAVESLLQRAENRAHSAAADLLQQAVAAQRLREAHLHLGRARLRRPAQRLHLQHRRQQLQQSLAAVRVRLRESRHAHAAARAHRLQILLHEGGHPLLLLLIHFIL